MGCGLVQVGHYEDDREKNSIQNIAAEYSVPYTESYYCNTEYSPFSLDQPSTAHNSPVNVRSLHDELDNFLLHSSLSRQQSPVSRKQSPVSDTSSISRTPKIKGRGDGAALQSQKGRPKRDKAIKIDSFSAEDDDNFKVDNYNSDDNDTSGEGVPYMSLGHEVSSVPNMFLGHENSSASAEFNSFRSTMNLQINTEDEDDSGMRPNFNYNRAILVPSDNNVQEDLKTAIEPYATMVEDDYSPRSLESKTPKKTDLTVVEVDGTSLMIGVNGIVHKTDGVNVDYRLPMSHRLVILCELGAGASSIVYKALDLSSMQLIALKAIHIHDRAKRMQVVKEVCVLYQMMKNNSRIASLRYSKSRSQKHKAIVENKNDSMTINFENENQYIVDMYDAFFNPEAGVVSLMLELMDGGSLQSVVDKGGCSYEPTLASIAVQALKGVAFLHSCSQMHRDLKPGNFLISRTGAVKVADLGIAKKLEGRGALERDTSFASEANMSSRVSERMRGMGNRHTHHSARVVSSQKQSSVKMFGDHQKHMSSFLSSFNSQIDATEHQRRRGSLSRTNTFVGTVTYMSPERLDGISYSYSSDIWSFGLSIMSLALGHFPLGKTGNQVTKQGGYWTMLQSVRDNPPPKLPANGNFSTSLREFIELCLQRTPEDRPTCRQLLQHQFLKKAVHTVSTRSNVEESDERKRRELHSIVIAIYAHIEELKVQYAALDEIEKREWTTQKAHRTLFGDFKEDSATTMLYNILFAEQDYLLTPTQAQLAYQKKVRKSRLVHLAQQLHMSLEEAIECGTEAYEFLVAKEKAKEMEATSPNRNR